MVIKTKRFTPNKFYSANAIKKQWHLVRLLIEQPSKNIRTNKLEAFTDHVEWIEDNIGSRWWSTVTEVETEETKSTSYGHYKFQVITFYMDFYFSKEDEGVMFQFAWQW